VGFFFDEFHFLMDGRVKPGHDERGTTSVLKARSTRALGN
jgi:hypothetical protein